MSEGHSIINISAPKFLDNALSEPAKEVGRTLANIFYMIFSPVNIPMEKLRIRHDKNLKKYEDDISKELNSIPEENLVEPPLSIIGPALEASKYYIEEDEIRGMFAKLIAASMDKRNSSKPHHSFVEIIKQMSPLDAENLKSFINPSLPIVNYVHDIRIGGSVPLLSYVFLENENCNDLEKMSISISNLQRLGIVEVTFDGSYVSGSDVYKKHEEHEYYQNYKHELNRKELLSGPYENYLSLGIEIEKGIITLTPLGQALKKVCID